MHSPSHCDRCQTDLMLYGESFFDGKTDEHYEVANVIRVDGPADLAIQNEFLEWLSSHQVSGDTGT